MPFLNFGDLRRKEVINMRDGARLGCICDLEVDQCSGLIRSIVVPGPPRFFGILRSDEELVIPYDRISKIGDDVILVDVVLKIRLIPHKNAQSYGEKSTYVVSCIV